MMVATTRFPSSVVHSIASPVADALVHRPPPSGGPGNLWQLVGELDVTPLGLLRDRVSEPESMVIKVSSFACVQSSGRQASVLLVVVYG